MRLITLLLLLISCTTISEFTNVSVTNNSADNVQCFLTVPGGDSPIGKFGISSDSIKPGGTTGWFWLKKGQTANLNSTKPAMGYIITFGDQNQNCSQAIANGWPTGINNFEFTINCWDKTSNPSATGGNESADITNVDGVNAIIGYSVDTTSSVGRKYWDYSLTDDSGKLLMFESVKNSGELFGDCNVPGIFPYDCDVCYTHSIDAPKPCFEFPKDYKCSDSLAQGKLYTCQINRPGQGGTIKVEFFGFIQK